MIHEYIGEEIISPGTEPQKQGRSMQGRSGLISSFFPKTAAKQDERIIEVEHIWK